MRATPTRFHLAVTEYTARHRKALVERQLARGIAVGAGRAEDRRKVTGWIAREPGRSCSCPWARKRWKEDCQHANPDPGPSPGPVRRRERPRAATNPGRHPYELFPQLEEIEHRTTKVRRPQSNGFVERLHRTLLDDHFRVMRRKKFQDGIEAMQKDLDAYLVSYNTERPHQGRGMKGRSPADVFVRCLPKLSTPKEEKMKKAA